MKEINPTDGSSGSLSPGLLVSLSRLARLTRKELSEILRDRRTIITLVLMPLLVYPLLSIAFRQFFLVASLNKGDNLEYRIGFYPGDKGKIVSEYLLDDRKLDEAQSTPGPKEPATPASTEPKVISLGADTLKDLERAIVNGSCELGIHIRDLNLVGPKAKPYLVLDCKFLTLEDSALGNKALRYVEKRLARANALTLEAALVQLRYNVPVKAEHVVLPDPEKKGAISLAALIPLILILMTITGAVYPAIDLTAGERERGTLEILVAAPIPRLGLLFAKYVTVLSVAVLTALVNLVMMTVTLLVFRLGPILFGAEGLSVVLVLEVFGLLLLFAAFFSAVLLMLTSFACSFKEAQAYLIPLMLVSLAPGMLGMMPGLKLSGLLTVTPLVNIVLLARDLFDGKGDAAVAVIVVLSTLLYALAALAGAARIFGAEGVLYSEQSNWSDLFRRPDQPQRAATVTSALFCVALLFPLYFVLHFTIPLLEPLELRLGMTALAAGLLFVVWPLLWGAFGRVEVAPAFQADRSGWRAFPGAILLGLCLWPFAAELTRLLYEVGVRTLGPEHERLVQEQFRQLRQFSPVVIVLVFAVVPAVCEELFFRGYLFSALRTRSGPVTTILATGFLFGFFHLVLGLERFAPTTLLGIVLGWICWRSRSIFPGMIAHACHNGVLVMLAYYQEEGTPEHAHLPPPLLLGAAVGVALGAGLVLLGTRRAEQPLAAN